MPPLTETVEGLLATKRPRTADARQFVGQWRGEEWMNADNKHHLLVRLRDSAGVLVGESVNWPEPNVELVMPLQYVKIVDGGLTWGYMNDAASRDASVRGTSRRRIAQRENEVRRGQVRATSGDGGPTAGNSVRAEETGGFTQRG